MSRKFQILVLAGALALLWLFGLGMRRAVLEAQWAAAGRELPFTLESALYFRRVEQVFATGRLPSLDAGVGYPQGVVNARMYTTGSEYVFARLARWLPGGWSLAERLQWLEAGWFCLGVPWMALWIGWTTRSRVGGALAGLFYAASIASIIRSTGQELLHENFALPFLIAHLAWQARAQRSERTAGWAVSAGLSSLSLALALVNWDLVQYYVMLWMAANWVSLMRGKLDDCGRTTAGWLAHLGGLLAAGLLNPYLRAHAFAASPAMLLGYGMVMSLAARKWMRQSGWSGSGAGAPAAWPGLAAGLLSAAPLVAWLFRGGAYGEMYGHFSELLWAKIRFLNQKPLDPGELTFNQRIMWVPALHSATWRLTILYFPAILPLTLIAAVVLWASRSGNSLTSRPYQLLFFCTASLVAFCLFVRFHVFLALFAAGLIGFWGGWGMGRAGLWRAGVLALLLAGVMVETGHALRDPREWGRSNVYYEELQELTDWCGRLNPPRPVLANFGVSSSIAAYGHCPIILHPKFESPDIREKVRAYGEALFKGSERDFRDWADEQGARYYVYSLGEFSDIEPRYQMRYFVDALTPPGQAAARLFEERPEQGTYFQFLWGNRKYRVFDILNRDEETRAAEISRKAEEALQRGDLAEAEARAVEAVALNPGQASALEILRHAGALREQGFGGAGQGSD